MRACSPFSRREERGERESIDMSVCLADHYSSLSVEDCLCLGQSSHGLSEDPLVDLPLLSGQGASFALPPGVQVTVKMKTLSVLVV